MSDSGSRKRFGFPELIGAVVIALLVGFYAGTVFVDAYRENKAPASQAQSQPMPPAQAPAQAAPAPDPQAAARIATLEQVVKANPKDLKSWVELANLYYDADQPVRAIPAYEKAVELDPNNPDVWTDLGVMYRQANRPKDALAAFDKAAALDPNHQNSRFNRGIVLLHDLNDRAGALAAWEDLLRINPLATTPDGLPVSQLVESLRKDK